MGKLTEKETIITINADWDYSPVIIYSSVKGVLLEGDNIHNVGYEYFAEGYAEALNIERHEAYIETVEDLEKYESFLKRLDVYDDFADAILD